MIPDPITAGLVGWGPPGVIIAALLVWVWRLHQELGACQDARVEDAKNYTKLALDLLAKVHEAIERLERLASESRGRNQR